MFSRRILPLFLLTALIAVPASAQEQVRIAFANTVTIFNQMQEVKDLQTGLEGKLKSFEADAQKRKVDVDNMQAALKSINPTAPQYSQERDKIVKAAIELDSWVRISRAELEREQKMQLKILFDKVQAAAADVAKQNGYDAVVAQQNIDLPAVDDPNVQVQNFRAGIVSRNTLYVSPKADLTNQIIALLDSRYKAGGTSTPAPAPAPAPSR